MRSSVVSRGVVVLGASLSAGSALAGVRVTDLFQFSTDANGAAAGGQLWDTQTGGSFAIWVSVDGQAINGVAPSTGSAEIDFELNEGSYSFEIWGQVGNASTIPFAGMNLFFEDSDAPGISVFAASRADFMPAPAISANSSSTFGPGGTVMGSGSLSYADAGSGLTVTLVDYFYALPTVFAQDVGTGRDRVPGGGFDYYGQFTLRVVPGPGGVVVLGVVGMLTGRRRR